MLSPFHLRAEKARRRLYDFVVQARRVLEPGARFVDGIHVHAICEHLQAVTEGRIRNPIINVPPGHAKSLLTAVFWPAWVCKNKKQRFENDRTGYRIATSVGGSATGERADVVVVDDPHSVATGGPLLARLAAGSHGHAQDR